MKRWRSLGLVLLFAACFTLMGACGRSKGGGHSPKFDTYQISCGEDWTLAMDGNNGIYSFGYNEYGQLGVGLDSSYIDSQFIPLKVIDLDNPVKIVTGEEHACALMSDNTVKCWGYGGDGEVGNGTWKEADSPVVVTGLADVTPVGIASGPESYHTCVLLNTGGMKCWGYNYYGQLGDGTTSNSNVPVDAQNLSGLEIVGMTTTIYDTCILLESGAVKCWGYGGDGELGDGNWSDSLTPVDVIDLPDKAIQISGGEEHVCALLADGTVYCWGYGGYGELGHGDWNSQDSAVAVLDLPGKVTQVSAGSYHTCALIYDGSMYCWGANWEGQLGSGNWDDSFIPTQVLGLPDAVASLANEEGYEHSCAILKNNKFMCWGYNDEGQVGTGADVDEYMIPQYVLVP